MSDITVSPPTQVTHGIQIRTQNEYRKLVTLYAIKSTSLIPHPRDSALDFLRRTFLVAYNICGDAATASVDKLFFLAMMVESAIRHVKDAEDAFERMKKAEEDEEVEAAKKDLEITVRCAETMWKNVRDFGPPSTVPTETPKTPETPKTWVDRVLATLFRS